MRRERDEIYRDGWRGRDGGGEKGERGREEKDKGMREGGRGRRRGRGREEKDKGKEGVQVSNVICN